MSIIEDKLKVLAEDPTAIQAITAVFTLNIDKEKPKVDKDDSDELIGQKYRAYEVAKKMLEGTLKDIKNYKSRPKSSSDFDKSK